jgi:hypothetical protein
LIWMTFPTCRSVCGRRATTIRVPRSFLGVLPSVPSYRDCRSDMEQSYIRRRRILPLSDWPRH